MIKVCSGIYAIRCVPTGKLLVGSSTECKGRCYTHFSKLRLNKHGNKYLQGAWNKYGEDAFVLELLEEVELESELKAREQWWINHIRSNQHDYGFNLAAATRQDTPAEGMSIITKEYWNTLSEEEREKRNAYKRTEKGRERLRQNAIDQWNDPEFCKTQPQKISATMKELSSTPEAKERLTKISNDYWSTNEAKSKMSNRMLGAWASLSDDEKKRRQQGLRTREIISFITLNGITKPLIEWSELSGLPRGLLRERLKKGVTGEAMFAPARIQKPKPEFVKEWLDRP